MEPEGRREKESETNLHVCKNMFLLERRSMSWRYIDRGEVREREIEEFALVQKCGLLGIRIITTKHGDKTFKAGPLQGPKDLSKS